MRSLPFRKGVALYVGIGAVANAALMFLSPYQVSLATTILIVVGITVAWGALAGLGGAISLGHGAFFALGAYGMAWSGSVGLGTAVGLVVGILMGAVGAVVAIPALRARGLYFTILTFAFAVALGEAALLLAPGGVTGLFFPAFGPNSLALAALVLWGVVLAAVAYLAIRVSRIGTGLRAINQDVQVARASGIDDRRYLGFLLVVSGAFTAFFGAMYALRLGYIEPLVVFDQHWSVTPALAGILGGMSSVLGAVVGGATWGGISVFLRDSGVGEGPTAIATGLVLLAITMAARKGLVGLFASIRGRFQMRVTERSDAQNTASDVHDLDGSHRGENAGHGQKMRSAHSYGDEDV